MMFWLALRSDMQFHVCARIVKELGTKLGTISCDVHPHSAQIFVHEVFAFAHPIVLGPGCD